MKKSMLIENFKVITNNEIAKDTFKLIIDVPQIDHFIKPGQFVNIRIGNGIEYVLRRPISISNIDPVKQQITLIYKVKGKGTNILSQLQPNDSINILGPLGNGYDIEQINPGQTALLLGGGIGVPPLYELAKQLNKKGVKTIHLLAFTNKDQVFLKRELEELGSTYVVTNDGSEGFKGLITDAIKQIPNLNFDKYFTCGSIPMMKSIINLNQDKQGFISLENRMACGIGACYACVCKTETSYTRVCHDGPVYQAGTVEL